MRSGWTTCQTCGATRPPPHPTWARICRCGARVTATRGDFGTTCPSCRRCFGPFGADLDIFATWPSTPTPTEETSHEQ